MVYNFAAILYLQYMVHVMLFPSRIVLYFYISDLRSMSAVLNMAVLRSSSTSYFPGMLLRYFLNYFEMVPPNPTIIDIKLVLK
jgi:hypothetical protein